VSANNSNHSKTSMTSLLRSPLLCGLLVGAPLLLAGLLVIDDAQALKSISTSEIMSRGRSGVGFSYWWGHGRWTGGGPTNPGACYGSCGGCSHKGSNGADCSGFVAKAWRVPDGNALEVDMHPYSTGGFKNERTYWKGVSRNAAKEGDAFVYNSGGKGHIVLFQSWTGKGTAKILEAPGCKTKIRSTTKSLGSQYIGIRRNDVSGAGGGNKDGSNVLCTIDAHCGTGKFCCDSDKDGVKHCTTQSCAAVKPGGGGTDPGDGKTECVAAEPNCANPYPNCCDNDEDGKFHCTSSTCKGCGHGVNETGSSLKAECNACTQKLCGSDPYCCEQRWDIACVQRAATECGQ
jgi:hypothetical protein